ncbi:hypothetical protein B0H11DRAFT_1905107 [Mycena galericulata]|nr:hypothetical protein B0H11DRAFT_1905107 [Mycena galericulata]
MACQMEVWETPMTEGWEKGCQTEDIPSPRREVRDAACQTAVLHRTVVEVLQPIVKHADSASQIEELQVALEDNIIEKQAREFVDPLSPAFTTQHAGTQPSLGNGINLPLLEAALDAALQAILTQTATELAQQLNCPFPDMLDNVLAVCQLVGSVPRVPSSTDTHASHDQAATASQAATPTIRALAHPQDYKTPPPPCMSSVRPADRAKVKSEIVAALQWGLKDATGQDVFLHWKDHERLIEFKHGWQIHGWPPKAMNTELAIGLEFRMQGWLNSGLDLLARYRWRGIRPKTTHEVQGRKKRGPSPASPPIPLYLAKILHPEAPVAGPDRSADEQDLMKARF